MAYEVLLIQKDLNMASRESLALSQYLRATSSYHPVKLYSTSYDAMNHRHKIIRRKNSVLLPNRSLLSFARKQYTFIKKRK